MFFDFQIWFWRSHFIHLRAWPWRLALWQRWDMPLSEIRCYSEGAGRWRCKALPGFYRAGYLLCVASSHCLLCPSIQDPCWEVEQWRNMMVCQNFHAHRGLKAERAKAEEVYSVMKNNRCLKLNLKYQCADTRYLHAIIGEQRI